VTDRGVRSACQRLDARDAPPARAYQRLGLEPELVVLHRLREVSPQE